MFGSSMPLAITIKKGENMKIRPFVLTIVVLIGGIFDGFSAFAAGASASQIPFDVPTVEVEELRALLQSAKPPLLIDVREPSEREIAVIGGDKNIPLGDLAKRAGALPKDKPIVIYCHRGNRSAKAVMMLWNMGFANVKSLNGGIQAWAERIDQGMKMY
jgi:sulfur-carrier protein adenylyltransferase/sulfurtransferase